MSDTQTPTKVRAPKAKANGTVTPLVPGSTYTSRDEAFKVAREAGLKVYARGQRRYVAVGTPGVFYLGGPKDMPSWDAMAVMA